jgi:hypothetical protein
MIKNAAHPAVDGLEPGELPAARLQPGYPVAHEVTRLVLLPLGPDTVHGASLPGTRPSTPQSPVSTEHGPPRAGI